MLISGLQKLTLLDYPGKVACTVFTPGCNLRCPFCHNAPLVLPELVGQDTDEEQVLSFLRKRQGVLDGVAITRCCTRIFRRFSKRFARWAL